jgi:large subunit ribosomal protein L15
VNLSDLSPAPGSRKARTRVGRGHGSGKGGRSGRGDKGQLSRAGGGKGPGFAGGQNPIYMRLPKLPGFKNRWRQEYAIVNIGRLDEKFEAGATVDSDAMIAAGLIKNGKLPVKILGEGELTKKLVLRVDAASASATTKVEAAGGKVELAW